MAGKGPGPKKGRVRRNADVIPLRVLSASPTGQPELPSFSVQVTVDEEVVWQEFEWPERTREWWQMWADSPLSNDFTEADWDFLLDTALLHARYWKGSLSLAAELRLRVAKFGQTPEDRARLRIQFAEADEADERRGRQTSPSRERRGPYKAS